MWQQKHTRIICCFHADLLTVNTKHFSKTHPVFDEMIKIHLVTAQ